MAVALRGGKIDMNIKCGLQLGAMCIALTLAASAGATTIDFDDLAACTQVTDQCAPQDVTFAGEGFDPVYPFLIDNLGFSSQVVSAPDGSWQ